MAGLFRETLLGIKDKIDLARNHRLRGDMKAWAEIMDAVTAERKIIEEWMAMTKLMAELETLCSCPLENTCYGIRV